METTFDTTGDALRNGKQRLKSDFTQGARTVKESASTEFKSFVADVEDVVKRVADVSDADIARVRGKIEDALYSAKSGINLGATQIKEQARKAAASTDEYVRGSPWQAIGIAAGVAALLGLGIGYFASRD